MGYTRRGALGLAAGSMALAGCLTHAPERYDPVPERDFLTLAHRGSIYLWPENTLMSVTRSIETGADVVEVDVDSTADGELVLFHDRTVDRTTDGSGPLAELSFEEARELDAAYGFPPTEFEEFHEYGGDHEHVPDPDEPHPYRGEGVQIPTLREVFEAVPDDYPLLLDIKRQPPPGDVAALIQEFDRQESTMVAAFEDPYMRRMRPEVPRSPSGLGSTESGRLLMTNRATEHRYRPPGEFLFPPRNMVREDLVERAHRNGLTVFPWTVNTVEDVRRIAEMGVDGLVTDDHVHVREVLDVMDV